MKRTRSRLFLNLFCLGAWLCGLSARAQIVLKPNGGNGIPLHIKSLTADTSLVGQFASTKLTLVFQNETSERIEAEFMYVSPPQSLVTSFAYWDGDEKVAA